MQHEARALVAAAAFAVFTGERVNGVKDQRTGRMLAITASCEDDRVKATDVAQGGSLDGTLPGLFDHRSGSHIDMKRGETSIDGFHYVAFAYYRVIFKGRLAEMFDFGDDSWSAFTID